MAFFKRNKAIMFTFGGIGVFIVFVLSLPGHINQFSDTLPILREKWLNAKQWTGMYSSYPEGVVDMDELDLSRESDVKISLNYSEELHMIDGYIHSDTFCEMGLRYRNVLLKGSPSIWALDSLNIDVYEIVQGHTVLLDKIRIDREVPQGIITVRSTEIKGLIINDTLRLAPDSELNEEELEFLCLELDADGELAVPVR